MFFTTANTCLSNLLHTAIKANFPDFPFALSRWYNALQAVFVLIAFIALQNISHWFASLTGYFGPSFNAGSVAIFFWTKARKTNQLPVILSVPEALGIDDQHGSGSLTYGFYAADIFHLVGFPRDQ